MLSARFAVNKVWRLISYKTGECVFLQDEWVDPVLVQTKGFMQAKYLFSGRLYKGRTTDLWPRERFRFASQQSASSS